MPVLIVVPARVGSTRLPNKPLLPLGGKPLIRRVVERALMIQGIAKLVVATDSQEVVDAVAGTGADAVLTRADLPSGTDRVAAVISRDEFSEYPIVVNLQGDEPFLPLDAVSGAVGQVEGGADIGTAAAPLDASLRDDPSRVKVVFDDRRRALYFSRLPIPAIHNAESALAPRVWWQHVGLYAYRREALLRLAALPPSALEQAEGLEQLRALEAGFSIGVSLIPNEVSSGIDTPEDLAAAESQWPAYAEAIQ